MEKLSCFNPDMAVLTSRAQPLSSFALLSSSFSDELLNRMGFSFEGYSPLDLAFLDAEAEELTQTDRQTPTIRLDLKLILQALRAGETETEKAREKKILERVLQLQTVRQTHIRQQISLHRDSHYHLQQSFPIHTINTTAQFSPGTVSANTPALISPRAASACPTMAGLRLDLADQTLALIPLMAGTQSANSLAEPHGMDRGSQSFHTISTFTEKLIRSLGTDRPLQKPAAEKTGSYAVPRTTTQMVSAPIIEKTAFGTVQTAPAIQRQTNAASVQAIQGQTNAASVQAIQGQTSAASVPTIQRQTGVVRISTMQHQTGTAPVSAMQRQAGEEIRFAGFDTPPGRVQSSPDTASPGAQISPAEGVIVSGPALSGPAWKEQSPMELALSPAQEQAAQSGTDAATNRTVGIETALSRTLNAAFQKQSQRAARQRALEQKSQVPSPADTEAMAKPSYVADPAEAALSKTAAAVDLTNGAAPLQDRPFGQAASAGAEQSDTPEKVSGIAVPSLRDTEMIPVRLESEENRFPTDFETRQQDPSVPRGTAVPVTESLEGWERPLTLTFDQTAQAAAQENGEPRAAQEFGTALEMAVQKAWQIQRNRQLGQGQVPAAHKSQSPPQTAQRAGHAGNGTVRPSGNAYPAEREKRNEPISAKSPLSGSSAQKEGETARFGVSYAQTPEPADKPRPGQSQSLHQAPPLRDGGRADSWSRSETAFAYGMDLPRRYASIQPVNRGTGRFGLALTGTDVRLISAANAMLSQQDDHRAGERPERSDDPAQLQWSTPADLTYSGQSSGAAPILTALENKQGGSSFAASQAPTDLSGLAISVGKPLPLTLSARGFEASLDAGPGNGAVAGISLQNRTASNRAPLSPVPGRGVTPAAPDREGTSSMLSQTATGTVTARNMVWQGTELAYGKEENALRKTARTAYSSADGIRTVSKPLGSVLPMASAPSYRTAQGGNLSQTANKRGLSNGLTPENLPSAGQRTANGTAVTVSPGVPKFRESLSDLHLSEPSADFQSGGVQSQPASLSLTYPVPADATQSEPVTLAHTAQAEAHQSGAMPMAHIARAEMLQPAALPLTYAAKTETGQTAPVLSQNTAETAAQAVLNPPASQRAWKTSLTQKNTMSTVSPVIGTVSTAGTVGTVNSAIGTVGAADAAMDLVETPEKTGTEKSLPTWAKEFLASTYEPIETVHPMNAVSAGVPKENGSNKTAAGTGWRQDASQTAGTGTQQLAANLAANRLAEAMTTAKTQKQMVWTSPNAVPAQSQTRPVDLAFQEKKNRVSEQRTEARMSEAEIKRTADRIYQMIETRLKQERRRMGY